MAIGHLSFEVKYPKKKKKEEEEEISFYLTYHGFGLFVFSVCFHFWVLFTNMIEFLALFS